jgi:hypothetical protein
MVDLPVAPPVITTTIPSTLNNFPGAVLAMLIICGVILSCILVEFRICLRSKLVLDMK